MLILAALCYSAANIFARRYLGGYHPFAVASAQTIAALAISLPAMLVFDRLWQLDNPTNAAWWSMLVMGIAGSGLAPLCHFTVLRRGGPVNAMLASIVVPITPIILGVAFLGERFGIREVIGGLVIAVALIIIDGRLLHRFAERFRNQDIKP